jgi:hypothetical protein
LPARTNFRRYRGSRVPFSSFARPDSFLTVSRASGLVLKFCAPVLIFGGIEGFGSRFHVLRARTRFRRYRGRQVPFSSFASPDSFSAVPRASVPVLKFCASRLVVSGTEGIGTRFLVLRARNHFEVTEGVGLHFHVWRALTHFRRYLGRRHPIFLFCAPGLVFGGTEGVGSRFQVLRARTRFRRYRGRRVPFSSFAPPDLFSAVSRESCPVFMFCAPELIFDGTWASVPVFKFCTPRLIFSGIETVGSSFDVLRARTLFRRYRGRRHSFLYFARPDPFRRYRGCWSPFSGFALPDSFSAVPRASTPLFMF